MRAVAAVVVAALAASGQADARTVGHCKLPGHAVVRATSARVVVYTVASHDRFDFTTRIYACVRRTGARQLLDSQDNSIDYFRGTNYRTVGRYVGWSVSHWDHYGGQSEYIELYDLRRRKFVATEYLGGRDPGEEVPDTTVDSLVLSRHGDLAWILRTYYRIGPSDSLVERLSVDGLDSFGTVHLDSGAGIGTRSLRIDGETVSWTNGRRRRSGKLRAAGRHRHCAVPGSMPIRARAVNALVYQYDTGRGGHRVRHLVGCLFHTGRRTHLADVHLANERAHDVEVARRYASLVLDTFDRIDDAQFVVARVFDLRRRRVKWSSVVGYNDGGQGTRFKVPSLVLAPNGAFAYIALTVDSLHRDPQGRPTKMAAVRARWRGGSRTLDSGPPDFSSGIAPWYLVLDGLTVSWKNSGQVRSFRLR